MRKLEGNMAKLATIISVVGALFHIFYISGLFNLIGIDMFLLQYRAGSLMFILLLTYMCYPISKKHGLNTVPWYDWFFIALAVISSVFMMIYSEDLVIWHTQSIYKPAILIFVPLVLAIVEAVRRSSGKPIIIIAIIFFIYPLVQNYIPGIFGGRALSFAPYVSNLLKGTEYAIYGTAFGAACSVIVIFCLLGEFMRISGASEFFLNISKCLLGRYRGGPAKVGIISASLFGMISGSVTAGVASTGSICIPMMTKSGYDNHFAGAVEAVACNGGQIMPPVMGMVVFVMADMTGISYGKIILASIIPAVLYYLALFVQVDMEAVKQGLVGLKNEEIPSMKKTLREGWKHVIPLLVLIFLLMVLDYSPEKAGLIAILTLIVVDLVFSPKGEKINIKKTIDALDSGMKVFLSAGVMTAIIGVIMGAVMQTGIGVKLSSVFIEMANGRMLILLLLTAVATYILGMGLGSIPLYIMMVVLTAPALLQMGISTMQSHLFVLWYGLTSFITPPVAIAIYVSIAISKSGLWKTGWTAMKLGVGTYVVPFLFMYRPGLLLMGTPMEIIVDTLTSVIAITAVALGASGQWRSRMNIIERILFVGGGFASMIPGVVSYVGFALVAVGVILQIVKKKTPIVA